ncbi:hypothetical protein WJX74_005067 [Apatococcus lobatus]|uniref:Uncharacterized protein n=1 Tax=Apatococcus lobatus TaxID=904363 RepID=A0AAW1Q8Q2_9CHLO
MAVLCRKQSDEPTTRVTSKPSNSLRDTSATGGLVRPPRPINGPQPSLAPRAKSSKPTGLPASPRHSICRPDNVGKPHPRSSALARPATNPAGQPIRDSANLSLASSRQQDGAAKPSSLPASNMPAANSLSVADGRLKPADERLPSAALRSSLSSPDGARPGLARKPLAAGTQLREILATGSDSTSAGVSKRQTSTEGPEPVSNQPAPMRSRVEASVPIVYKDRPSHTEGTQPRDDCTTQGPSMLPRDWRAATLDRAETGDTPSYNKPVQELALGRCQLPTADSCAQGILKPRKSGGPALKIEALVDAETSPEAQQRVLQPREATAPTACIGAQLVPRFLKEMEEGCAF